MTRNEAWTYLRDKAEGEFINPAVKLWAEESNTMLFVLDSAPAEEVIAVIFEQGFVMGMETLLNASGLEPFEEYDSVRKSAEAWSVLRAEFVKKAEREHYGIE